EPLGDEAAFPLFLVCEQARNHVTVALTGDGGDEAFAGYERYVAYGLAARIPAPLAAAGRSAVRLLPGARRHPRSPLYRTARLLDVASEPRARRYARLMEVFPPDLRRRLWNERPAGEVRLDPPEPGVTGLQ